MKKLTFATNRRPTPERTRAGIEEAKRKAAEKRYLKSVKYCQRCGKEVYPDASGSYPLSEVFDNKREISLLVCDECKEKGGERR